MVKRQSKKRNPAPGFTYGEAKAIDRYIRGGGDYAVVYRISPGRYGIQVTDPKTSRIKRNIERRSPKWKAFLSGKVSPRKNRRIARKNPKRSGYIVEVDYHTGPGGAQTYYLYTGGKGVALVNWFGDEHAPTIYRTKQSAVRGIHRLMRSGRDIVGMRLLKV